MKIRPEEITTVLERELESYEAALDVDEVGTVLEVPVGPALLGRVVNALGQPLDGKGPVTTEHYRQIEFQAPGIVAQMGSLVLDGSIRNELLRFKTDLTGDHRGGLV